MEFPSSSSPLVLSRLQLKSHYGRFFKIPLAPSFLSLSPFETICVSCEYNLILMIKQCSTSSLLSEMEERKFLPNELLFLKTFVLKISFFKKNLSKTDFPSLNQLAWKFLKKREAEKYHKSLMKINHF